MLVVASPFPFLLHNEITSGQYLQIFLKSLWYETRMGFPKEEPTMLGRLDLHAGFSLPTGGTIGSGETLMCVAVVWGRGSAVSM